jgi:predicted secreted protein
MSLPLSIALYFVIWWTTLFAVLPIGMRTQGESGEVVPGTPASAPAKPRMLWVIGVNTIVATVVFAVVWIVVAFGLIPVERPAVPVPGTTR